MALSIDEQSEQHFFDNMAQTRESIENGNWSYLSLGNSQVAYFKTNDVLYLDGFELLRWFGCIGSQSTLSLFAVGEYYSLQQLGSPIRGDSYDLLVKHFVALQYQALGLNPDVVNGSSAEKRQTSAKQNTLSLSNWVTVRGLYCMTGKIKTPLASQIRKCIEQHVESESEDDVAEEAETDQIDRIIDGKSFVYIADIKNRVGDKVFKLGESRRLHNGWYGDCAKGFKDFHMRYFYYSEWAPKIRRLVADEIRALGLFCSEGGEEVFVPTDSIALHVVGHLFNRICENIDSSNQCSPELRMAEMRHERECKKMEIERIREDTENKRTEIELRRITFEIENCRREPLSSSETSR